MYIYVAYIFHIHRNNLSVVSRKRARVSPCIMDRDTRVPLSFRLGGFTLPTTGVRAHGSFLPPAVQSIHNTRMYTKNPPHPFPVGSSLPRNENHKEKKKKEICFP